MLHVSLVLWSQLNRRPEAAAQVAQSLISSQYGGYVLDEAFDHYDRGLREAVAWIMAHSPTKRPTMMQLQDILATGNARVFDEQERVSIAELLGAPPQP